VRDLLATTFLAALTCCFRIEFPYPKETPFKDKTAVAKASKDPDYNHTSVVPAAPKDKTFQRVFKRQAVKVELLTKGGFLRSDTPLGAASVKLQPLETRCTVHEAVPLMDGRRVLGGKVEVLVRLRNPLLTRQVEKVEEKWLVISFK